MVCVYDTRARTKDNPFINTLEAKCATKGGIKMTIGCLNRWNRISHPRIGRGIDISSDRYSKKLDESPDTKHHKECNDPPHHFIFAFFVTLGIS